MAKDEEYKRLIHTARWQRLRYMVLSKHPLCQMCEKNGIITAAREVHHIRPVEEAFTHDERRTRMYDESNLMALCHDCHVKIHTQMGRSGREATKARNDKQVKEINKRFFGDE